MWHAGFSNISATFPFKSRNSHKKSLYTLPRVGRLPDTKRRAHLQSGSVPHWASVQFQGKSYSVAFANSNSWETNLLTDCVSGWGQTKLLGPWQGHLLWKQGWRVYDREKVATLWVDRLGQSSRQHGWAWVVSSRHSGKGNWLYLPLTMGAKTGARYESYWELNYAHDHNLTLIPIQLCKDWPQQPEDHDGGDSAQAHPVPKSCLLGATSSNVQESVLTKFDSTKPARPGLQTLPPSLANSRIYAPGYIALATLKVPHLPGGTWWPPWLVGSQTIQPPHGTTCTDHLWLNDRAPSVQCLWSHFQRSHKDRISE